MITAPDLTGCGFFVILKNKKNTSKKIISPNPEKNTILQSLSLKEKPKGEPYEL
jgi:hypothetical protein